MSQQATTAATLPVPGSGAAVGAGERLPQAVIDDIRRTRRHPRVTQFDYLHLRHLVDDLARELSSLPPGVRDVLDLYCGTRPYDDLLPPGASCVGLDIDHRFGGADIVSSEFLPFDDGSFDLVVCIEAFYYVADPVAGAAEIMRVLRPGGTALIAVPFVWEYDPGVLERRFTGLELKQLFAAWDGVRVIENGGRGVAWALLTGRLLQLAQRSLPRLAARVTRPAFAAVFALVNGIGALLERSDRRRGGARLPANLMLIARRPS